MNETKNTTTKNQSPVDTYVGKLIADIKTSAPKNRWEELPPLEGRTKPQYRLHDADGNIVTLTCDTEKKSHSQYTLRVTDAEERLLMRSMEWKASGYPSELGTLYAILRKHYRTIKPSASKYATPEQTDSFIQALLRDAQMERPSLSWKRNPNREVFTLTETNFSQYCTLPQYISNSYISCKE